LTTTFDFTGKKAVATGAGGAIGGEIARGLAQAGAQVAIWDISLDAARTKADEINQDHPDKAIPVECNAIDKPSVEKALAETLEHFDTVDLLLNGAGGSHPSTTTTPELEFFDIAPEAVQKVMDLNYLTRKKARAPSLISPRLVADCPYRARWPTPMAKPPPTASPAGSPCIWLRPTHPRSASTPSHLVL